MSEAPTPETPRTPESPQTPPANGNQAVPYDRFKEVNDRAKAAEEQLAGLQKWKEEQEAAKLSDIERANAEREKALQRAEEAEKRAVNLERSSFVRAAAQAAKFLDPEDALVHLNGKLDALDTPEKARDAVADLAKNKKHLVGQLGGGLDGGARGGEPPNVPRTPDGKVDVARGLGQDLLATLTSQRAGR